jgi:hypothetical protein
MGGFVAVSVSGDLVLCGYPRIVDEVPAGDRTVLPTIRVVACRARVVVNVQAYSTIGGACFRRRHRARSTNANRARTVAGADGADRPSAPVPSRLIQSDGCRAINRVRGANVERTSIPAISSPTGLTTFENCSHAPAMQSASTGADEPYNVAVSRRDSVALLDTFVGPKA